MNLNKFYRKKVRPALARFGPRRPVYVFHHLPKCGGSSVRTALKRWFLVRTDYRVGWSDRYPNQRDLSKFRSGHCLIGHFETDGHRLVDRYPEVFDRKNYRLFTFIRDPLEL